MPPIIEDYADIKRRMDALANPPSVNPLAEWERSLKLFAMKMSESQALFDSRCRAIEDRQQRAFARGGFVKPSSAPYIVGDGAPELFVPDVGTWIEISADGSGGGGCEGHMVDDVLSDEGREFMQQNGVAE